MGASGPYVHHQRRGVAPGRLSEIDVVLLDKVRPKFGRPTVAASDGKCPEIVEIAIALSDGRVGHGIRCVRTPAMLSP